MPRTRSETAHTLDALAVVLQQGVDDVLDENETLRAAVLAQSPVCSALVELMRRNARSRRWMRAALHPDRMTCKAERKHAAKARAALGL